MHLFVNIKELKLEEGGARLSMEAWSGSGSSVWCLLDKQTPGPDGVVDVYGAGYVPVRFPRRVLGLEMA